MNEVFLLGNLVADPRTFDTKNGPGANCRVAVNRKIGDVERTLYINVKCFGNSGRDASAMKKGDRVLVKGYLENDEYTNKEGVVTKDVVINAVIFSKQERRTDTSPNTASDSVGF